VTVPPTPPTPPWTASCPTSAVLFGILYAADLGLDVINLSLGGNFQRRDGSAKGGFGPSFIATINSVFNYTNKKGTTVVVAAGNSAINFDTDDNNYGAYCNAPHVVCVSATGPTASAGTNGPWQNVDALAAYSNFGATAITVAAPGGTARGPVWAACSSFSLAIPVCQTGTFIVGITGTSMAAPHAAGVAALIAEDVGHKPSAIRARLIGTSDDLGPLGLDPAYGNGRINAARAVGLN
jgi:subtilisin family serine protease